MYRKGGLADDAHHGIPLNERLHTSEPVAMGFYSTRVTPRRL
jgi:hypothetical protein